MQHFTATLGPCFVLLAESARGQCSNVLFQFITAFTLPAVVNVYKVEMLFVVLVAGPSELTAPGFAARTGFLGALSYYLSVHVFEALKPKEGLALITTTYVVHGILSDLSRQPLDYTHPVAKGAHAIMNVPMPHTQSAVVKQPHGKAKPAQSASHSTSGQKKDR